MDAGYKKSAVVTGLAVRATWHGSGTEPPIDNANMVVFEDIAETLHQAFLELGYDSVRVQCENLLEMCASEEYNAGRQVGREGSRWVVVAGLPSWSSL